MPTTDKLTDAKLDDTWERVREELDRRGKSWAWLADRMGTTRQAVGNWKKRGVPLKDYPAIAVAFGETADWVAGQAPPRRETPANLSTMALRIAQEFDRIEELPARLDTYTKIVTLIAIARTG